VIGPRDLAVIARQLGRAPRDLNGVAARCPFGYPAVIETAPLLSDGAPNPTLFYLVCPTMVTAVSRAEACGAVRRLKSLCQTDADLGATLAAVTRLYRERRARAAGLLGEPLGPSVRPDAGIGGPVGPEVASCLHAYAAAFLAVRSGWLSDDPGAAGPPLSEAVKEAWAQLLPPVDQCWCADRRCGRWAPGERRAAIDMGTISVRLLVADSVEGRPQSLVRKTEITRLGQGLSPQGVLAPEARRRTAAVVARFVQEAREHGSDTVILAGTSATRDAADGEEFVRALGREHSIEAVVLSGKREAELAFAGASLDLPGDSIVLLDVGGGSTEVIGRPEGGAVEAVSLDLGASRATERWITSDPPTPGEIAQVRGEAERILSGLRHLYGAHVSGDATEGSGRRRRLVGVAGTVTTLACLDAGLESYDSDLIHLRSLSVPSVRALVERLSRLTTAERAALPCVQAGRAPVLVGGAVIVLAAMETLGYDVLTVSERDLLDGLVLYGLEASV